MRHFVFLAAAAAMLCACQTASAPPTPAARYHLIDLTGAFSAYYDQNANADPAARAAAFRTSIQPLFPAFYLVGRPGFSTTEERYSARINRAYDGFAELRPAYTRAAADFAAMLDPALASFQQSFPDASDFGDIYLIHSLGEMDGGTRDVDGTIYFVFGADMIARLHTPGTERPFFHHELFHRYQFRWFPGCGEIWCGLWTEGTAVLAAKELNPAADDEQLLLTVPEPIRGPVDANLNEAVCTVRAKLNSSAGEDWGALFSADRLNERLPPRFGYYVGYLAAREVRKTHTLQQIAHMTPDEVRPALDAALASLAACPAN